MTDKLASIRDQIAFTILKERRQRGLTQRQLAEKMKVAYSLVNNIEAAHANPTLETLIKFAEFFDIRVSDLFLYSYPCIRRLDENETEGCKIFEIALQNEEVWQREVDYRKQLTVRVKEGNIIIRAEHLQQRDWGLKGYNAIIPGGGKVEIMGWHEMETEKNTAQVLLIETARREGR